MNREELIKAALKKKGLSEGLWEKIQVETDDGVDAAVEEFAKTYTPPKKTFADFVKEGGYEKDLTALIQSEADKRVTTAISTFEEKLNLKTKPKDKDGDKGDPKYDELMTKITELTEAVQGQKETQEKTRLNELITSKIKESGLPEGWLNRVSIKEESEIEGAVKKLETEYNKIKQEAVDTALTDAGLPGFSVKEGSTIKTKIETFAKDLSKEEDDLNVAKLEN